MSESFTTADGRKLSFRREGSGPTLVCHPGGPGFSSRYFGDLAGLGRQFELVLLEPRGTAHSDRPADASAYRVEDYVADLEELRAHLGLETFDLLGHSHGGIVAMGYAARYPTRLGRLVLASTAARFSSEQEQAMAAAVESRAHEPWYADARDALEREERGDYGSDAELAELALREFPFYFGRYDDEGRAYLESLRGEVPNGDALRLFNTEVLPGLDLRPDLALIDASTLVVVGELDFITGPASAEEIADGIAGAELVILAGIGHFVFVEARDRFREEVQRFLA